MKTKRLRLYEIGRPYYCAEEGYYYNSNQITGAGEPIEYSSITEYLDGWGDACEDMNFIFRWDWERLSPKEYYEECGSSIDECCPEDINKNGYYSVVKIFYMMQRKGCKKVITIRGAREDEEELLYKHLKKAWARMMRVWDGVSWKAYGGGGALLKGEQKRI